MVLPPEGLSTRKKLLRHGVESMDFRRSQRKCHAAGASVPTTRCFTQVSGALPVVAACPEVSRVVRSVRTNPVNSWRKRSRIGILSPTLVPGCLHPTLKSTLNLIAGIGSDLRRHDVLLDHVPALAETSAAKRDLYRSLPAPTNGKSQRSQTDSLGRSLRDRRWQPA